MLARDEKTRRLTREFRDFLNARSAWPLLKQYPSVLQNYGGGRKADISRMKAGESVSPKFIRALIELLQKGCYLQEFAVAHSIYVAEAMNEDWLAIVSLEDKHSDTDRVNADNWFEQGISGLVELFTRFVWGPMLFEEMQCRSEAEAAEAAVMTFESVGRQLKGIADRESAIQAAEEHMGIRLYEYQSRVINWWTVDHRVVLFATVDRVRVGCSIVLPVTEPMYRSIQSGQKMPYQCAIHEIQTPSAFIVLESLSERSIGENHSHRRISAQQLRTLFLQVALLNEVPQLSDSSTNVLAFSGTQENGRRLKRFGFTTCGKQLPNGHSQVWEMDSRKTWLIQAVLKQIRKCLAKDG